MASLKKSLKALGWMSLRMSQYSYNIKAEQATLFVMSDPNFIIDRDVIDEIHAMVGTKLKQLT